MNTGNEMLLKNNSVACELLTFFDPASMQNMKACGPTVLKIDATQKLTPTEVSRMLFLD